MITTQILCSPPLMGNVRNQMMPSRNTYDSRTNSKGDGNE